MNHKRESLRENILKAAEKQYGALPERPWAKYPEHVVLRHKDNKKWFALFMSVGKDKLGLHGRDEIDILNIKVDSEMAYLLTGTKGYFPGYHMNKKNWISVLLDGTVSKETILSLLDMSFRLTDSKKKSSSSGKRITNWLIPANPKYYDIQSVLRENPTEPFTWKQSSNIMAGDTVYLYLAAPVRAILYKCKVLEVDIPYQYEDTNLSIRRAMRLQLEQEYEDSLLTSAKLKEYGVYAVRGPRSMPDTLINDYKL